MRSWKTTMASGAAVLMVAGAARAVEQSDAAMASAHQEQDAVHRAKRAEIHGASSVQRDDEGSDRQGFVTRDELEKLTREAVERLERERAARVAAPTFTDAG